MWHRPKDVNYYNRLALVNKVKKLVEARLAMFQSIPFEPAIPYSYGGGKKTLDSIERFQYESCFKRIFSVIRCKLSDGSYVKIQELRTKHLTKIYQVLSAKI
jgi:hypothetical protein